ncbi:predicted protein [Phaeodactylum tricornutum CCAP 1055/1]|jgi:prolyl 4-hydroxylase|uniref:Fe2OG dioxygenase domain-containing protein n=2 Tax=Phaeodactylum tricornutum TaxID=2850 RepID=B5Y4Z8_PHATC|nr:predicted protein [Phaeodactylum tricornutum CCAP 1055/1]ACI65565.1 predicted protein [Phaeodactylum tricornutum CCAP 1055/1]|eukprot:XP_002186095.1 predicted protein [Phaeodactylum tricornutum CCAP 1055/1]
MLLWIHALLLVLLSLSASYKQVLVRGQALDTRPQTCAEWTGAECAWEPNLQAMNADFGRFNETFYAYVVPDVATFYNKTPGSLQPTMSTFKGMFGKFTNLSPDTIRVSWISGKKNDAPVYISDVSPFDSAGTATYVGHQFIVTDRKSNTLLTKWTMVQGNSLYFYDPFDFDIRKALKALTAEQLPLYNMQLQNKMFAEQYKTFTGTDWLALYRQKFAPRFHMWRADAIGQTYTIETNEIHFVDFPDEAELARGTSIYGPRPDERDRMRRLRARDPTMNMTMTVLSCVPRVFEVKDFLSDMEVEHLLNIASKRKLKRSTMHAGGSSEATTNDDTRTSTNDWIPRHQDLITDTIYRRAADLLQMDEALLRWRRKSEIPEFTESHISISERLQLVNYQVGQQYTPHHDFTMPGLVNMQPSRFATLLFYLNDDMDGGETAFPRWLHADEEGGSLKVKPEKGKAILFYNLLPDGNYDERSEHAALPVRRGEKWLTNLVRASRALEVDPLSGSQ